MPKSKHVVQPIPATREALIDHANKVHAKYPQYKGHFDHHVLVTMTQNVRAKGSRKLAFVKGEVAIAAPTISTVGDLFKWRSVYSPRHKAEIAIFSGAAQDAKGFRPKEVDVTKLGPKRR